MREVGAMVVGGREAAGAEWRRCQRWGEGWAVARSRRKPGSSAVGRRPDDSTVGRRSGSGGHGEEVVRRICMGIRVVFFFWGRPRLIGTEGNRIIFCYR